MAKKYIRVYENGEKICFRGGFNNKEVIEMYENATKQKFASNTKNKIEIELVLRSKKYKKILGRKVLGDKPNDVPLFDEPQIQKIRKKIKKIKTKEYFADITEFGEIVKVSEEIIKAGEYEICVLAVGGYTDKLDDNGRLKEYETIDFQVLKNNQERIFAFSDFDKVKTLEKYRIRKTYYDVPINFLKNAYKYLNKQNSKELKAWLIKLK